MAEVDWVLPCLYTKMLPMDLGSLVLVRTTKARGFFFLVEMWSLCRVVDYLFGNKFFGWGTNMKILGIYGI